MTAQIKEKQLINENSVSDIKSLQQVLFFKNIWRSHFCWIIFALLVTELFLYYGKPLKFVHVRGTMLGDQDYVGNKINAVLSKPDSSNTLLFGDSTADSLCLFADIFKFDDKETSESRYNHLQAKYGQSVFLNRLNLPLTIKNLYFGGCMMSDQSLLLEKLLERGCSPKLAVLTLVPRPFMDTTINVTPVHCFFQNRYVGLEQAKNFSDLFRLGLNSYSSIYRTHSDYAVILSSLACSSFNKPVSAYVANGGNGINSKNSISISGSEEPVFSEQEASAQGRQDEVEHYKKSYIYDEAKYKFQFGQFQKMLALLKSKNVTTIIVKLPLGASNLSLMKPEILSMWNKNVEEATTCAGAHLIDLQSSVKFSESDFKDSIHLKGSGGVKVWDEIVAALKMKPKLVESLKDRLNGN